jgi:microcin C transport system substrate-binding protein
MTLPRLVLATAAALVLGAAPVFAQPASHGLSSFGELKYPAGFKNFAYVNPSAPKGGRISTIGVQALRTFDSFNPYILKGDPAQLMELTFDSLMARATDEADSMYGLVAESVSRDADGKAVTFKLRTAAKFSDGTAITADDVVFTLAILKEKGSPPLKLQLRDVVEAKALDPATVRYTFKGDEVRKLPLVVAGLPILSKAYYATREFDQTTLEPPLGSGPYKIGDFKQGTHITYRRREDYWGKDLPVNLGRWNFDDVRIEYYRDRTPELEALKAGVIDLREEFTARDWVTGYEFPAVKDGRVVRATLPDANPSGAQGWFYNTRRAKFQDARVRKALDLAFDYEWTNKNIFSGLYTRTASFFENSDMKASGKPSLEELALLEPFKAQLPETVFGEPVVPHVSDGSGNDRKNLREAVALLEASGFAIKDGKRVNAKGEVLDIEFLITDVTSERILGPYVKNLNALGIATAIRRIDQAQYERRRKSYDYDVLSARFVISLTPGPEVKNLWSSEAAKNDGSFNLAGIQSPVVDALIGKITEAKSRAELLTATRALDRVLRAGQYWVPQWFKAAHNIAHWDKFGRPATKPLYDRGIIDTWWYDAEKAAKLKSN